MHNREELGVVNLKGNNFSNRISFVFCGKYEFVSYEMKFCYTFDVIPLF